MTPQVRAHFYALAGGSGRIIRQSPSPLLCATNQVHVTDTKRDRELVNGNDRRISSAAFEAADVLLTKA